MRYPLVLLTLALSSLTVPAHADEVGTSSSCALVAVTDLTREAGWQTGAVAAGPAAYVDPNTGGPANDVVITCSIQVNSADPSAPDAATVSSTSLTGVAFLPPTSVSYAAATSDAVYVCSQVAWTTGSGPQSFQYDADPNTPGTQCALTTVVSLGAEIDVVTSGWMDYCVWLIPPRRVCVPSMTIEPPL